MISTAKFGSRQLLVPLLLCLILFVQVATLTTEHVEHGPFDHCCLLCHVGPMAVLPTSIPAAVLPAEPSGWLLHTPLSEFARETLLAASSSRAPPV